MAEGEEMLRSLANPLKADVTAAAVALQENSFSLYYTMFALNNLRAVHRRLSAVGRTTSMFVEPV
jgi:hypothetical protein